MLYQSRIRRKKRIRAKIKGTAKRPRLSVYKSNKYIYAQAIDDDKKTTLASSFGKDPSEVGSKIAEKIKKKKLSSIVFDRGGYQYHGKIKKLADSAREGGLKF